MEASAAPVVPRLAAGLACGPGAPVCSLVLGIGFGIAFSWLGRKAAEGAYDLATEPAGGSAWKDSGPLPAEVGMNSTECPNCHKANERRPDTLNFGMNDNLFNNFGSLAAPKPRTLSDEDMAMILQWMEKTPAAK